MKKVVEEVSVVVAAVVVAEVVVAEVVVVSTTVVVDSVAEVVDSSSEGAAVVAGLTRGVRTVNN